MTFLLDVRVTPGAKKPSVGGAYDAPSGRRLIVRVAQPPEDGRANAAVCAAVAQALGLPTRSVSLHRGHKSRDKTVAVDDPPTDLGTRVAQLYSR